MTIYSQNFERLTLSVIEREKTFLLKVWSLWADSNGNQHHEKIVKKNEHNTKKDYWDDNAILAHFDMI